MPTRVATARAPRSRTATGVLLGLVAYGLWGLFPLYFALLDAVPPVEVVAHRVLWSLVFLCGLLGATRSWAVLVPVWRDPRRLGLLTLAAVLIAVNWGVYVWAVATEQVVEASLGYFINPLVSVALAVVVLRERLRRLQWAAVLVAVAGVLVLTLAEARPPWISLVLAFSFGLYGLVKKVADVDAVPSLTTETAVLAPVAIGIIALAQAHGGAAILSGDPGLALELVLLGPITAVPLLAFGAAAVRIPLSMVGLLQYLTPSLQLALGVLVFQEPMSPGRWLGFAVVWAALALSTYDALRHARQHRRVDELEVAEPL